MRWCVSKGLNMQKRRIKRNPWLWRTDGKRLRHRRGRILVIKPNPERAGRARRKFGQVPFWQRLLGRREASPEWRRRQKRGA